MSNQETIDIEYVANLARIELTDEEKVLFSTQLQNILGHFEKLRQINVEHVDPTAHAFPVSNVWREDVPEKTFTPAEALRNAPAQRNNQIVVPKVVE